MLRWAFSLVVFAATLYSLAVFSIVLVTEQRLGNVADAALREASLPSASSASATTVAVQAIYEWAGEDFRPNVTIFCNDRPMLGPIRFMAGDELRALLVVERRDVLPSWLLQWNVLASDAKINVLVSRVVEAPRQL